MRKNPSIPVLLVSMMLLVFAVWSALNKPGIVVGILFSLSPLAVIWLVYRVVRFDRYRGRELGEREEWGYADRQD